MRWASPSWCVSEGSTRVAGHQTASWRNRLMTSRVLTQVRNPIRKVIHQQHWAGARGGPKRQQEIAVGIPWIKATHGVWRGPVSRTQRTPPGTQAETAGWRYGLPKECQHLRRPLIRVGPDRFGHVREELLFASRPAAAGRAPAIRTSAGIARKQTRDAFEAVSSCRPPFRPDQPQDLAPTRILEGHGSASTLLIAEQPWPMRCTVHQKRCSGSFPNPLAD